VGDAVAVEDDAHIGMAIADPESPIMARMWTHDRRPPDGRLFEERLRRAVASRERAFADGETTAMRLLHGEGDRTPGIVIDRYEHVAVVRTDGAAADKALAAFLPAIERVLGEHGVTSFVKKQEGKMETLAGEDAPPRIRIREHGIPFWVDLARGQKTGAFLDQRENRRRVQGLAAGRRVLNLFSYAGGFSLFAAVGGATHVTSVDIASGGHATAQDSFRLAGVDPQGHSFVTADAFDFLKAAAEQKKTWDLVVSDPPSFAPNEKSRVRALTAYRKLHRAAAAVLSPSGVFCASSCSSHVNAEEFLETLDDETLGLAHLRLVASHGPPWDHPTLPAFPEGRYLKFAVLA
jgi:23S rRNA (cytosine1962-C5)-methyltransferase